MASIKERIRRLMWSGTLEEEGCQHKGEIREVEPMDEGCVDCLKIGDSWVHLRMCLTCGYIGCCDNSKNKHATKHHNGTDHPLVTSFEPGEDWIWCYVDQTMIFPD